MHMFRFNRYHLRLKFYDWQRRRQKQRQREELNPKELLAQELITFVHAHVHDLRQSAHHMQLIAEGKVPSDKLGCVQHELKQRVERLVSISISFLSLNTEILSLNDIVLAALQTQAAQMIKCTLTNYGQVRIVANKAISVEILTEIFHNTYRYTDDKHVALSFDNTTLELRSNSQFSNAILKQFNDRWQSEQTIGLDSIRARMENMQGSMVIANDTRNQQAVIYLIFKPACEPAYMQAQRQ